MVLLVVLLLHAIVSLYSDDSLMFTGISKQPVANKKSSKDRPQEQTTRTITVKIMKKSKDLLSYDKKTGQALKYFNAIGAAGNYIYRLKIYQIHKFTVVRTGSSYKFANCIEKADGLWVVSKSSIGFTKPVDVDKDLQIPDLPEEEPAVGSKRTLAQALISPSRSSVKAKIVKVSPVKFTREGTLPVRCLGLKDESGRCKVALFADLAEKTYSPHSTIELTSLYQKTHEKKAQLVVSRETTCQYLPDDAVPVEISEEDQQYFLRDGDFAIPDAENLLELEADSIIEIFTYEGCKTLGCRLKKLKNGICPNCEGQEGITTFYAKISVTGAQNNEYTLFQADLEKLFGKQGTTFSEEDLLTNFIERLPVKFQAKITGRNLYNITTF